MVGIILMALGIGLLVYSLSPLRFMVEAVVPHENTPVAPILGALALIGGIALLYIGSATRLTETTNWYHRSRRMGYRRLLK
jgi:hypothetical protein